MPNLDNWLANRQTPLQQAMKLGGQDFDLVREGSEPRRVKGLFYQEKQLITLFPDTDVARGDILIQVVSDKKHYVIDVEHEVLRGNPYSIEAHFETDQSRERREEMRLVGDVLDLRGANISNSGGQLFVGKFLDVAAQLNASGKQEFGAALQDVLKALENDHSISAEDKENIAGVVTQLGEETTKQKPNRMTFQLLLGGLFQTINAIPSMIKAAEALAPYMDKLPF